MTEMRTVILNDLRVVTNLTKRELQQASTWKDAFAGHLLLSRVPQVEVRRAIDEEPLSTNTSAAKKAHEGTQ